jgi:lipopolysaccharide/colanic/teichoic acid biosynthesis glycosyltransferase
MYRRFFKKLMDRLVALFLLIVLSPLMAVVALAIYLDMGSPILFRQKRPGEGEKIFTIYKFRTMSMERDENGELLPDERRLGPLGRRLRSLSLDELPQLFNIVKGDMSFVGPRPLLDEYLPLYDERQRRRHEVTPGITGWAQVNGRNAISWKEKFEYDLWYVEHQSFSLDMKILWMTLVKVLRREGIAHEGSATMEKFRGNG